ncbi:Thymidylate synthase [Clarias magur]|uniref:Thymidylate synthase n=1 Tax=Clarias magur TaxID=1594786 RepID=A0A8J4TQW9_CLAMG|nr:Thymidylate synthase [Clarias magur]
MGENGYYLKCWRDLSSSQSQALLVQRYRAKPDGRRMEHCWSALQTPRRSHACLQDHQL